MSKWRIRFKTLDGMFSFVVVERKFPTVAPKIEKRDAEFWAENHLRNHSDVFASIDEITEEETSNEDS